MVDIVCVVCSDTVVNDDVVLVIIDGGFAAAVAGQHQQLGAVNFDIDAGVVGYGINGVVGVVVSMVVDRAFIAIRVVSDVCCCYY